MQPGRGAADRPAGIGAVGAAATDDQKVHGRPPGCACRSDSLCSSYRDNHVTIQLLRFDR